MSPRMHVLDIGKWKKLYEVRLCEDNWGVEALELVLSCGTLVSSQERAVVRK